MATNTARRMAPDLNNQEDWQARYEDLLECHEDLRRNAADVVRANKAMRNSRGQMERPLAGIFHVLLAVLAVGRLIVFELVQHGGTEARVVGVLSSIVFGVVSIVLLYNWVRMAWEEAQWLAIVQFVLVFVPILISLSVLDDGAFLSGDFHAEATHPMLATVIAVSAFLLAASPLELLVVQWVWNLLAGMFQRGSS